MARPNGVVIVSERFWAFAGTDGSLREGEMLKPPELLQRLPLARGLARLAASLGPLFRRTGVARPRERWLLAAAVAAPAALFFVPAPWSTVLGLAVMGGLLLTILRGRTLRLHGAEHRAIAACEERRLVATWAGDAKPSRFSPRCGTNFAALAVPVTLLADRTPLPVTFWSPLVVLVLSLARRAEPRPAAAAAPGPRPAAADDARAAARRDADRAACRRVRHRARASIAAMSEVGTMRVKSGLAEMLKGGVIMDVVTAEQAKVAEAAGACAVMALERVPADIRRDGGVARMSDPDMIHGIQEAVTIPVMAKCRIGHFVEAQVLQALEIDYIDESEVLTPADVEHHVDKWQFTVPFVCGCTNLGEALRRIAEGAAMIRTKGEAGTGDIVNAVTHMRAVFGGIRRLQSLRDEELFAEAKNLQAPYELVRWVSEHGRLPVVTFTAGGIATPADAALCMQLGADGVFVGSGIFKSGDPEKRARAIVEATTHYMDADVIARVSAGLGEAMVGISTASLEPAELLERRGW